MQKRDFTITIMVDQTPEEAFEAISRVSGWWSGEIEGCMEKLGDEFTYRYKDFHYSRQRLVEVVPGKRIVWLVTEASINFVTDKSEWTGTKIVFDISGKNGKTEVRFIHEGLVPLQECYDACSNAWTGYIGDSLRNFIVTGGGKPRDLTIAFVVDQTPDAVFEAVNNVRGWWSENIEGDTDIPGSEFRYHFEDVHFCRIRIIESLPSMRVVWMVMDNYFKFTRDKSEWKNTKVIFDIAQKEGRTELRFTHQGLVPECECYAVCNEAWKFFILSSLRSLIASGKGAPTRRDDHVFDSAPIEKWQLQ